MIDISQWRVSIGSWVCHQKSYSSAEAKDSPPIDNNIGIDGNTVIRKIRDVTFLLGLFFLLLLILSGDIELNPGPRTDYYVPAKRECHSTHIVGDYLYMWGGSIDGLPKVHDNEVKQRMTSVIELFHLPTGKWKQQPTNGKQPLGVTRYASTVIGNRIYYFGGYCYHDMCHHNSLNLLTTDSLTWFNLFSTNPDNGPMLKSSSGMIPFILDGEDYLLVVGGFGPRPKSPQPGAQYHSSSKRLHEFFIAKFINVDIFTNEHHYYKLSSGQWIVPGVIGEGPPPCHGFTLTPLPGSNRAVFFAGITSNGYCNTVYLGECMKSGVQWQKLSQPRSRSIKWPHSKWNHAATVIGDQHVMVLSGYEDSISNFSDGWLFNVSTKTWKKLDLPKSMTKRWGHTLSVWNVLPTVVLVVQFGGFSLLSGKLSDPTMIQLICNDDQWSIEKVITNLKSSEEYQLKLKLRQETSVQPSERHEKSQLTVQSPTSLQPCLPHSQPTKLTISDTSAAKNSSTLAQPHHDTSDPLLKTPKCSDLISLLAEINHEWESIGTALEVPLDVLGSLRTSNQNDKIKLIRVIDSWFYTMPTEITWNTVLTVIEGPIVNNKKIGKKIRDFLANPDN